MSNYRKQNFTDQELITVYLFGILQQHFEIKQIYNYILNHWLSWFPDLPSYQAFNRRINLLTELFPLLVEDLLEQVETSNLVDDIKLMDAMPIILSAQKPDNGKVAKDIAGKGYCSSKNLYYHGIKLHVLAIKNIKALPVPQYIAASNAGAHDLQVAKRILPQIRNCSLYADKIYSDIPLKEVLAEKQKLYLNTPVKRKKGRSNSQLLIVIYLQQ